MRFFKSKFFIISVTVALVLAIVTSLLSMFGFSGIIRSGLKTIATPFEWCGTTVANAVNGFVEVFAEYDDLKKENEELRARLDEIEDEKHEISVLRDQNDWLKSYLDLKSYIPELTMTDVTVIAREAGNYSTVLTINKGYVHGIRRNMPVVTDRGTFGYVSECGLDWAKVVSIIETASSVSVYTERTGATGVVEGDTALRAKGYCVMTYVSSSADIKVGDRIFTSGNATIYPPGLLIGEIVEISADEATRTLRAVIKPSVDFDRAGDINNLMVITGYANEG
ncbi:MAG: rod shape-determining protein MreC [Clostridia bacterium]|nr:rod shape-determining protein MreC [Clostridia bacterium]